VSERKAGESGDERGGKEDYAERFCGPWKELGIFTLDSVKTFSKNLEQ
jgi:hypothetical protein